jgi:tetratricopeptide (TPR) repeat protein
MVLGSRKKKEKRKKEEGTGNRSEEQPSRTFFLFSLFFFLFPWLLGAVSFGIAEDLLRRGNAAFGHADFAAAVEFYARAEESAIDPGLVAFNKATALYHLGRYREAEMHYRFAREDATDLRLARLLYDLGNCILQQAQERDARRLKEAMDLYEQCLQQEAADAGLIADAQHNLELARLLWVKAGGQNNSEPGNEDEQPRNGNDAGLRDDSPRTATLDARGKSQPLTGTQPDPGGTPASTDQAAPPGKGNLPTLPDTEELAPLSAEDAAEHLKQAAARILHEHREHLRQRVPASSSNVKDW